MTLSGLSIKNIGHNWLRTILTVVGTAIAILSFVLIRTTLNAWEAGVDNAAQDRLSTIHRVTFVMPLPKRYFDEFNGARGKFDGIKASTYMNWVGHKHPVRETEFFATMAVDSETYFDVYSEMSVPPEQLAAWKQNRQGAIIGKSLAKQFGWSVGDDITLTGTIYPGEWKYKIEGIYSATKKSVDNAQVLTHWSYLNDTLPEGRKDMIGWIGSIVSDPARAADIAAAIDAKFDDQDVQTRTMSDKAMTMEFLGGASAILSALDIVSLVILGIMMLILGNTIAMGVRERTHEYGTLRAIGFLPRHLSLFVLGEAITIGLLGGGLGLALALPFINGALGPALEENLGQWFPYFRVQWSTASVAMGLAVMFSLMAAAVPAYQVSRLKVTDALRRVG